MTKRKCALRAARKLPLFHLMPAEQFERLKKAGKTWSYAMKHYRQPDWCSYPNALDGMMGCWSLINRKVTGEPYCAKGCDQYKPVLAKNRKNRAALKARK